MGERLSERGKKFCARGQHWASYSQFAPRNHGKLQPWCKPCKREYDKKAVAKKRAAGRLALSNDTKGDEG